MCDGKIFADLLVDGKKVIEILQEEHGLFKSPKTSQILLRQRGNLARQLCEKHGLSYFCVGYEDVEQGLDLESILCV